jgi:N-acetylmuramoyl-L-alanine amidase
MSFARIPHLQKFFVLLFLCEAQIATGGSYDCFAKINKPHTVLNVRIGVHPEKTRLVIEATGRISFKAVKTLDAKHHEILLENVTSQSGLLKIQKGQGLIQAFTFEQKDSHVLRLQIKTKTTARISQIFSIVRKGRVPDRLVIDLKKAQKFDEKKSMRQSEVFAPPIEYKHLQARYKKAFIPLPQHKPIRRTVVIDAGHGGQDPGTIGPNKIFEKHITLIMAQEIKRQVEKNGRYRAVLTREKDEFMRLRQRFARAREVNADLFISLHADSHPNKKVRGLSVYTLSDQASDKEAAVLASKENKADVIAGFDFKDESLEVANILIDLTQSNTMNLSVNFAEDILESVAKDQKLSQNTHRFADFAVLKAPDVPSVLIELGYLSNPIDSERLLQKKYQKAFASDIVRAIDRYFQKLKR